VCARSRRRGSLEHAPALHGAPDAHVLQALGADLQLGADLLAKARALHPATARERDYIEALAVFYANTDKLEHDKRADAYAKAMHGVIQRNPQDREAAVFYALALLGSGPERDPNLTNAKLAVGILTKLYDEQPDHPGIAHYIIHACDNPPMASLALPAARKYAGIAPASAHAVHMPSHIFARLGLWQDDIHSNLSAIEIADKMAAMHVHVLHHKLHSMDFLEYAYLQIGDDASAKAQVDAFAAIPESDADSEFKDYFQLRLASAPATYAIERRQWEEAATIPPKPGSLPQVQAITYWCRAVGLARSGKVDASQKEIDELEQSLSQVRANKDDYWVVQVEIQVEEAKAWLAHAKGEQRMAISLLRSAADKEDRLEKRTVAPGPVVPAREQLGDLLLELNQPAAALGEFEAALASAPLRRGTLSDASQAAERAGDSAKAAEFNSELRAISSTAKN
jgi:hypothetical protein